ncbi:hypothetical protein Aple_010770 [Acrocarpospora pleiomorpha]|uniref:Tail assembly chaperone n=1 Tax=Acrocarpospora pleiomorpha TaxID=90975 RepID=A0A5M3XBP4_9ACTN|nr:hypothetical protein [Acrocarpospora pleiomorpha]GES18182.1 hypothetical protein Aple_010770 [Acrocarpospora pleiomorpha]
MTHPTHNQPYGNQPYGSAGTEEAAPPAAAPAEAAPPAAAARPALLTAGQIMATDDRAYEDVPVPEWGGTVRVRSLTGTERDRFEQSLVGKNNQLRNENFRAKLAQLTLVDELGQLLFSKDQISALGRKSSAALARVVEVASKLSGLSEDDLEELEGE